MKEHKAIYPGSFDPFHEGHLDVLKKALKLFTYVYIVVTKNINKNSKSSFDERVKIVKNKIKEIRNVTVIKNENDLTVNIAHELGAKFIIRGLRDEKDFENELDFYDGNKFLDNEIEIVYFISETSNRKLSSTIIREIEFYKKHSK